MIPGKLYALRQETWMEGVPFPANALMVYLQTEGITWDRGSWFLCPDGVVRKWFHSDLDVFSHILPHVEKP